MKKLPTYYINGVSALLVLGAFLVPSFALASQTVYTIANGTGLSVDSSTYPSAVLCRTSDEYTVGNLGVLLTTDASVQSNLGIGVLAQVEQSTCDGTQIIASNIEIQPNYTWSGALPFGGSTFNTGNAQSIVTNSVADLGSFLEPVIITILGLLLALIGIGMGVKYLTRLGGYGDKEGFNEFMHEQNKRDGLF